MARKVTSFVNSSSTSNPQPSSSDSSDTNNSEAVMKTLMICVAGVAILAFGYYFYQRWNTPATSSATNAKGNVATDTTNTSASKCLTNAMSKLGGGNANLAMNQPESRASVKSNSFNNQPNNNFELNQPLTGIPTSAAEQLNMWGMGAPGRSMTSLAPEDDKIAKSFEEDFKIRKQEMEKEHVLDPRMRAVHVPPSQAELDRRATQEETTNLTKSVKISSRQDPYDQIKLGKQRKGNFKVANDEW